MALKNSDQILSDSAEICACVCRCTLWRHVDICTEIATYSIVRSFDLESSSYKVCKNCAQAIIQRAKNLWVKKR